MSIRPRVTKNPLTNFSTLWPRESHQENVEHQLRMLPTGVAGAAGRQDAAPGPARGHCRGDGRVTRAGAPPWSSCLNQSKNAPNVCAVYVCAPGPGTHTAGATSDCAMPRDVATEKIRPTPLHVLNCLSFQRRPDRWPGSPESDGACCAGGATACSFVGFSDGGSWPSLPRTAHPQTRHNMPMNDSITCPPYPFPSPHHGREYGRFEAQNNKASQMSVGG